MGIKSASQKTSRPEPSKIPTGGKEFSMGINQSRVSTPNRYDIPNHDSTEIEIIDIEDEIHTRPVPFCRPTPRRQQRLYEVAFEDNERIRKENDPPASTENEIHDIEDGSYRDDPSEDFLALFKHGFHREIVTGTMGKQKIYYITPDGTRVGTRKALSTNHTTN